MATDGLFGGWYRTHLGEPLEPDHVTGYWAFLLGALLALVGLVLFLVASSYERGTETFWLLRRVAFTLALIAGPLVVLSVVYFLPLQARAFWLALVGLLICVGAAVAFNVFYPDDWNWASGDMSAVVMAGYGAGVALQILTIFLYPLVSSGTVEPEVPSEPVAADGSKATFQLYQDRRGAHRWRLLHDNGNVLGDSGQGYATRQKARQGLQSVKANAPEAEVEVLASAPAEDEESSDEDAAPEDEDAETESAEPDAETTSAESEVEVSSTEQDTETASAESEAEASSSAPDAEGATDATDEEANGFQFGAVSTDAEDEDAGSNATFEVYQDSADEWRWRLRHDNGNIIADPGEGYSRRAAVDEAVERMRTVAAEADTLDYEPAAFELYEDAGGEWRWRLRHRNGRILADSGEGYASRRNARDGIESVREHATDADRYERYEDEAGDWRWRLVAPNGELVADSGQGYSRESTLEEAVERLARYAPEADTLQYDPAAYELFQDNADEWRWRLRHRNGQILADSGEGYASKQKAKQGMQSVRDNAPGADSIEVED